jgi:hypothetical protein
VFFPALCEIHTHYIHSARLCIRSSLLCEPLRARKQFVHTTGKTWYKVLYKHTRDTHIGLRRSRGPYWPGPIWASIWKWSCSNPITGYFPGVWKYGQFTSVLLLITYLVQIKAFLYDQYDRSKLSIFSHPGKITGYWITTRSFPYRSPYWPGPIWAYFTQRRKKHTNISCFVHNCIWIWRIHTD